MPGNPSDHYTKLQPSALHARAQREREMPELEAVALARDFRKCDKKFRNAAKVVQDLINEGYTPDEALMLSGFGGYGFDN